jgi:hypothetical protein
MHTRTGSWHSYHVCDHGRACVCDRILHVCGDHGNRLQRHIYTIRQILVKIVSYDTKSRTTKIGLVLSVKIVLYDTICWIGYINRPLNGHLSAAAVDGVGVERDVVDVEPDPAHVLITKGALSEKKLPCYKSHLHRLKI